MRLANKTVTLKTGLELNQVPTAHTPHNDSSLLNAATPKTTTTKNSPENPGGVFGGHSMAESSRDID